MCNRQATDEPQLVCCEPLRLEDPLGTRQENVKNSWWLRRTGQIRLGTIHV